MIASVMGISTPCAQCKNTITAISASTPSDVMRTPRGVGVGGGSAAFASRGSGRPGNAPAEDSRRRVLRCCAVVESRLIRATALGSDALDHRPGHALFRRVERSPWILAHAAQALGDVAHVEVVEAQILGGELLPGDRRRHGCVGARPERVWSD